MKIKCLVRSIENETEALILHFAGEHTPKDRHTLRTGVYVELLARQHGVPVRNLAGLLG